MSTPPSPVAFLSGSPSATELQLVQAATIAGVLSLGRAYLAGQGGVSLYCIGAGALVFVVPWLLNTFSQLQMIGLSGISPFEFFVSSFAGNAYALAVSNAPLSSLGSLSWIGANIPNIAIGGVLGYAALKLAQQIYNQIYTYKP